MSPGAGDDAFWGALEKTDVEPPPRAPPLTVGDRSDGGGGDEAVLRSEGDAGGRRGWGWCSGGVWLAERELPPAAAEAADDDDA